MNDPRIKGRWRTPLVIGTILVYLNAYIFTVASLMEQIEHWAFGFRAALFCLFGILWIFPLGPLFRWSQKDPNSVLKNP